MVALEALHGAVGIGHRPEIAADLLAQSSCVDFIEVVAEACLRDSRTLREIRALSRVWPVIPHGVKLSLGSAEGIDEGRARRLGELARTLSSPAISEHVALTFADGQEIGHLT